MVVQRPVLQPRIRKARWNTKLSFQKQKRVAEATRSKWTNTSEGKGQRGGKGQGWGVFRGAECHPSSPGKALQLPASPSASVRQAVQQRPCHALEDGHHLGGSQSPVHIPAEHAGPPGNDRLALGLLHQPQRSWLPHQVRRPWPACFEVLLPLSYLGRQRQKQPASGLEKPSCLWDAYSLSL